MKDIKPTAVKPIKPSLFATEIVGRRPMFKTHTGMGHAKNAIKQRAPYRWFGSNRSYAFNEYNGKRPEFYARLFKLVDDEWVYVPEFSYEPLSDPMVW
jgi:hypothetical protein